ncbi:MAG: ABC transporter permease [Candidatus Woesearchaeota archaeon]
MKIISVIKKNIKLLLRNKVSNFVLILGPLLIIFLVGLSFSTSSFNIKVSVFSEQYSPLSESLIKTLTDNNYFILKENSETDCINSVIDSFSQACLIFPRNMKISNDKQELIKIYVDQSKINLAYLVLSTLMESLGQKTTEISKELTDKLISSIIFSKAKLNTIEKNIKLIDEYTDTSNSLLNNSASSILSLDFSATETQTITTESINIKTTQLITDSLTYISDSINTINSLDDWVMSNGTSYLNKLKTNLNNLKIRLETGQTDLNNEFSTFEEQLDQTISDFSEKLEKAKNTNQQVYNNLLQVIDNLNKVKANNQEIKNNIRSILDNINSIEILNSENIANPIITQINPVVKQSTNLGFLFPSLISMLIMFTGIFLASTLVIMEKNSRAFFRVFTTPNKNRLFVFATYLTSLLVIFIQLLLIFLVSNYYFKIEFNFLNIKHILIFIISLIIIITFFIFLGLLIGNIFNSEEISMLASLSIGTIFLLTSGVIFPLESMPSYIIEKAKYNPMYISTELIKKATLTNINTELIKSYLLTLFIYSIIIALIILFIKKYKLIKYRLKKLVLKIKTNKTNFS